MEDAPTEIDGTEYFDLINKHLLQTSQRTTVVVFANATLHARFDVAAATQRIVSSGTSLLSLGWTRFKTPEPEGGPSTLKKRAREEAAGEACICVFAGTSGDHTMLRNAFAAMFPEVKWGFKWHDKQDLQTHLAAGDGDRVFVYILSAGRQVCAELLTTALHGGRDDRFRECLEAPARKLMLKGRFDDSQQAAHSAATSAFQQGYRSVSRLALTMKNTPSLFDAVGGAESAAASTGGASSDGNGGGDGGEGGGGEGGGGGDGGGGGGGGGGARGHWSIKRIGK